MAGTSLSIIKGPVAALLLLASVFTLYQALSTHIVKTQFATTSEMVLNLYPESDYLADNPDADAASYAALLDTIDAGTEFLLGLSDRARFIYEDLTREKGYTVVQGATQLWDAGDLIPALLILIFSVAFPIAKTVLMVVVYADQQREPHSTRGAKILNFLNLTHKYTMLDVFVVAVTVFAFSNQALVSVRPDEAVYWYIGYMIASFAALAILEHEEAPEAPD